MNTEFVGFRFRPTDEEIITYFLEIKMRGHDFPVHAIDEVDLCKYNPWQLPELSILLDDQVWYFFSAPAYKYASGKRNDRKTSDGQWKKTGKDREIKDKQSKVVIGIKKTLVFYEGRSPNTKRTNWVIHEYHSKTAPSHRKEFVLCRLKRKYDDKIDASQDELSHFWASGSGTLPIENNVSQVNHELPVELESLDYNGLDYDLLQSLMQMEPSNTNGSINGPNVWDSQVDTSEQEDDFVNSLLADQLEEYVDENVQTRPHGFNPTKSLRRVFVGDSSESDTEIVHAEFGKVLGTPSFFNGDELRMGGVREPTKTRPSSNRNRNNKGGNGFFHDEMWEFDNSDTDMAEISSVELVRDEFPPSTSACKSQRLSKSHNFVEKECAPIKLQFKVLDEFPTSTRNRKSQHLPKSHNLVEKGCAPKRVQLQGDVSPKAVSKEKARDAEHAIDLTQKENTIVKSGKDRKPVQTTRARTNLKSRSTESDGNNRKNSSISAETSPPPLVYLGNVVIGVILLLICLWEMASVH